MKKSRIVATKVFRFAKRKCLIAVLLVACALPVAAQKANLNTLYAELDDAIAHSAHYVKQRRQRIAGIKKQLARAQTPAGKYALCYRLFDEYHAFVSDSALHYIGQCIVLAQQMGDKDKEDYCKARLAFQCSTTGLYTESRDVLAEINATNLPQSVRVQYYLAQHHLYSELSFYTKIPTLRRQYNEQAAAFLAQLLGAAPRNSNEYLLQSCVLNYGKGNFPAAIRYNDALLRRAKRGTQGYAIAAFYRSLICAGQGRETERRYWLAESALSDVRNAVMDQGSLWELANLLAADKEQLYRSHAYIRFAWDAATTFGTRLRSRQIAPVLSHIDANFQQEQNRVNHQQRNFIIVVSVLLVLLFSLLYYVNRQRGLLFRANGKIKDTLNRLRQMNQQLLRANENLNESNRTKEEYVGRFMELCSLYITQTEALRRKIAKSLKTKDFAAMEKIAREGGKESEEFHAIFDAAFLHLFPNFVKDFNHLLRPEARMDTPEPGKLSTSIRVFALIRLGIKDSSKIAAFLQCSVNTVYNYRAQVKNGAIGNRDCFEQDVKAIGMEA